jgi:hypothetical protein
MNNMTTLYKIVVGQEQHYPTEGICTGLKFPNNGRGILK